MILTTEESRSLGELISKLESLFGKYDVLQAFESLKSSSFSSRAIDNPALLLRVLAYITSRADLEDKLAIGEILDDLPLNALEMRNKTIDEQSHIIVGEAQGTDCFGLKPAAISVVIIRERERLGLSQAEAATLAGVTRQNWRNYEAGEHKLRPATLDKVAHGLRTTRPELVLLIREEETKTQR